MAPPLGEPVRRVQVPAVLKRRPLGIAAHRREGDLVAEGGDRGRRLDGDRRVGADEARHRPLDLAGGHEARPAPRRPDHADPIAGDARPQIEEELLEVKGVGKNISSEIIKLLNANYLED